MNEKSVSLGFLIKPLVAVLKIPGEKDTNSYLSSVTAKPAMLVSTTPWYISPSIPMIVPLTLKICLMNNRVAVS